MELEQVKCECGHVNPHGTVLCESCGKPLIEDTSQKLLDMRYEGSARRSQTYNKTVIDQIWNFFSSVKVGVWLIVVTLVASALGTIYPQEMYIPPTVTAAEYYEDQYGFTGAMYYQLGFHNLYGSWWYMILIASIGISLVICSLDRVVPLYRALKKQGIKRNEGFLRRQRLFSSTKVDNYEEIYDTIKSNLQKKRYNVREENGNILAEKGRFSRWGPYVNHVGLIIFLIGAMLRFFPGMYTDEVMWIREGETKSIPGTNGQYFLKNEEFIKEVYEEGKEDEVFNEAINRAGSGMVVKNYQTNVTLYERDENAIPGEEAELIKVKDHDIKVNIPLKHDHYALYQVDYKLDELSTMSFNLVNKASQESMGNIKIDLRDPQLKYDLQNDYSIEIVSYFPDFYFDNDGNPASKSKIPNNPAFVFKMYSPQKPEGEISFVAIQQNLEPFGDNTYKMSFSGIETKDVSALIVRRDFTLWILGLGGIIFMVGVVQGMYWVHRRVWVQKVNGEILIAGHTNKNWFGLKNEINSILMDTKLNLPIDQTQEEEKVTKGSE
ncbi:cytochrome c biogenesis protein ResB [Bacillus luteolus]|uniref:Cytochrome c biogenesis protein ResB n=1 Tax=Litchfieldia luteola TaxID=682179 RepID=A0ABR9QQ89_9BACI|nr:cytochrome c biogenesis protein ResB [Cytobacillus luteolus]MBE4910334.1 cytochrome c biogenesis protein ResB [Cytobacillus luteolus]MBP1942091.1 cytochrome c biogenesis protein [Cytobacillus luteolus]